jgi:hypothetical protein
MLKWLHHFARDRQLVPVVKVVDLAGQRDAR